LLELARSEDVEATVIGRFGTENSELILRYKGTEVGRLSMDFVHKGIPMRHRKAVYVQSAKSGTGASPVSSETSHGRGAHATIRDRLLAALSHPNIASKHWIIRQYDHEVQGGSVIKPLTGPVQMGPSDAAVIRPKLNSYRGIALGCGLAPQIDDPYQMAIAAIDEAIRNVVAVGADPSKIAILDNFCWPSVEDERTMGDLARTCEACYDAAKAYGIPFISGKDSLHNQFTNQETKEVIKIPNTLLISAIGVIDDVRKCVTMDLKSENFLVLIGPQEQRLANYAHVHRTVANLLQRGFVRSCHDVSDGGYLVALAEMCIASRRGAVVFKDFTALGPFETPLATYVLELTGDQEISDALHSEMPSEVELTGLGHGAPVQWLQALRVVPDDISIDEMTKAWRGTLDW